MPIVDINTKSEITETSDTRDMIISYERVLRNTEGVHIGDNNLCPLNHSFADGIYVREIFIPAGTQIAGKIHKHSHPNFLMKGEVLVVTEGEGEEHLKAPLSIISEPGTKRALFALTDLLWITVHANPTNTQDLEKIEKEVIANDYKEYDKYISSKLGIIHKITNFLTKIYSK